ncbi:TPA: crosslink repair DNA glycosylase YcaQ family protein [Pseudomonas aeruginosa]|uniref:winged helix-turn-helix domain-containing protein n=1 Tax=Pseudomonas aeruginosa TaxID=287 RepID=UPI00069045B6|nr:crosslink repair DNA glycosylase YcaQ family protein [Pseudomonas aeruginosa]AVE36521.1 winged helix-turn-helix domain-containing protein [Pseudomonas aeruginosa]EKX6390953.1 YcaQ family DNA glycosylase [Pseudomonas aeruginosa]ELL2377061.1 YcaQ family DNA glycosylase [Pseudomonas aeruginosa]KAA5630110.1 winged helix-turn-helix domain-containing protein [Pseudomonas aeruginosa]KSK94518.1 cytoplasmic protein [Pseudomonas aeruginosa]
MKGTTSLSSDDARRLALTAQCFEPRAQKPNKSRIRAIMQRLGALQLDAVNALIRSHYLPLYSRLGHYEREDLDLLAWGELSERGLFEYWGHEASLMPLELYPFFRWRMLRAVEGRGIHRELVEFGRDNRRLIREILSLVKERGPTGTSDVTRRETPAGTWWDWSMEKLALEWLFATGELTVACRRGFERLYDLPERVFPAHILRTPEVSEPEAHRYLLAHAAQALGVATESDFRDYFRLGLQDVRVRLSELVEDGNLIKVDVEGWTKPAWIGSRFSHAGPEGSSSLLSPFDSLIWSRERTERLFNFYYRLEFYVPANKRVYGYYVMPFLYRGYLVGRVDLRAERTLKCLAIWGVHEEVSGLTEDALIELSIQLEAISIWLGFESIRIYCESPVANRLRTACQNVLRNINLER